MATKDRSKAAYPVPPGADAPAGRPVPPVDLARVASLREDLVRLSRELNAAQEETTAVHQKRRDVEQRMAFVKERLTELVFGRPGESL